MFTLDKQFAFKQMIYCMVVVFLHETRGNVEKPAIMFYEADDF